jgi:hypothetical protein
MMHWCWIGVANFKADPMSACLAIVYCTVYCIMQFLMKLLDDLFWGFVFWVVKPDHFYDNGQKIYDIFSSCMAYLQP